MPVDQADSAGIPRYDEKSATGRSQMISCHYCTG